MSPEQNNASAWTVVTGAGSGMGRAVAHALSGPQSPLILVGRRPDALAETAAACSGPVEIVAHDVSSAACRQQIVKLLARGQLAHLIQIAGVMEFDRLAEIKSSTWEAAFATHVHARLYLFQAVRAWMRPGSRHLLVSSRSGTRPRQGAAAYCCSYAAARMLNECLRLEWQPHGILLTSFLPGSVDTPLLERSIAAPRDLFPDGAEYAAERARGVLVPPTHAALLVQWLLKDAPPEVFDQPEVSIADPRFQSWLNERISDSTPN